MVQCGLCGEAETDAYAFFGNTRKRQREEETPPTEKEWAWRRWLMQHDPTLTWQCAPCAQTDAAEGHLYRRVNLSNDQMMALAIEFAGGEEALDRLTTLLFASWRFLTCAHRPSSLFLHQVCASGASALSNIFVLTGEKVALTPTGRSLLFPPLPESANVTRYNAELDSFQPAKRRLKGEEKPPRPLPSAVIKKARGKEVVESDVPYRKAPTSRKKANEEAKRISEGLENGTLMNIFPALLNGVTEEYDGAVRMSQVITHTPTQMKITEEGTVVTNQKGYRLAKSTHGFYEGSYLFSLTFLKESPPEANARVGVAQISADLQSPLGWDTFGVAWRGQAIDGNGNPHLAGGGVFCEAKRQKRDARLDTGFLPGDTVTFLLHLPPGTSPSPDYPAPFKGIPTNLDPHLPIPTPTPIPRIKNSFLAAWRNGEYMGLVDRDLLYGKWHIGVSCYGGARVKVDMAPSDFSTGEIVVPGMGKMAYQPWSALRELTQI